MKIKPFKIEEWMNKYESKAKYDMTTTCIRSFSLKDFFEFTEADFSEFYEKPLDYGNITGSIRLKQNVSSMYKNKNENNVAVTLGAIGANSLVFYSIIEKDDEVVSVIPSYQQHYSVPEQLGAKVKFLRLKQELNYHIDLEELENMVSPKTKLIILTNPNNPTGSVLTDKELEKIVQIAQKNNSYILCDEVYRFLNHSDKTSTTSIADMYEKGISTFSMSKTFSLAGIRVGFVITNKNLIKEINHQRQYNTISVSAVDDYIACIALENKDKIIKRNLEHIKEGRTILMNWAICEPKICLSELEGGTTAFASYYDDRDSYDFCLDLYNDTGVLLLPGDAMEYPYHFRIGFCGESNNFQEGLKVFSKWLKKY